MNNKTELLYLWIQDYKKLKNVGFNFSNKYKFDYNPDTGSLKKTEFPYYLDNYFPEPISNFTAVVGANKTGKTTLIKFILEHFTEGYFNGQIPALVILKTANNFVVSYPNEIRVNEEDINKLRENYEYGFIEANRLSVHPNMLNTTLIYYTSFFDPFLIEDSDLTKQEYKGMYNLSTYFLLYSDIETYLNMSNPENNNYFERLNYHALMELHRQVIFLSDFNNNTDFKLPGFLLLRINDIEKYVKRELKDISDLKLSQMITSIKAVSIAMEAKNHIKDAFLFKIAVKGIVNFIKDNLLNNIKVNSVINNYYTELINSFVIIFTKNIEQKGVLHNFHEYIETIVNNYGTSFPSMAEKLKRIEIFLRQLSMNSKYKILKDYGYFDLRELSDKDKTDILNIVQNYYDATTFTNFLDFIFSHDYRQITALSSGEYSLLSLFSRLYWMKHRHGAELENNILFLIDEAELAFHPRWQRSFIKLFVDFIVKAFASYNVQIILTSHSPFILSDMPPNNVIYLKELDGQTISSESLDEHPHTLAANIHELLSDSFFLDDKLVGDYISDKIGDLISKIKRGSYNHEEQMYIEKLIELIGEPYIKTKIKDLYYRYKNNQ